jgi:hypothetical protein
MISYKYPLADPTLPQVSQLKRFISPRLVRLKLIFGVHFLLASIHPFFIPLASFICTSVLSSPIYSTPPLWPLEELQLELCPPLKIAEISATAMTIGIWTTFLTRFPFRHKQKPLQGSVCLKATILAWRT